MPHVVTQSCCSDASCVFACPVNCIHPTPDEPDFATAEMLYVDPAACVDCGACVTACPVDAIVPAAQLSPAQRPFLKLNADFYAEPRPRPTLAPVPPAATVRTRATQVPLRVAIVGAGPAAMYAADELLTQPGVRVNVLDRLPTPGGLVRAGVAPDHRRTKQVTGLFDTIAAQPGFHYLLNVCVPTDISHEDLLAEHHAVIYAVGAATDRRLGIPGESLPGCSSATDFVAWYNGHPDHTQHGYDLSGRRAVVIGNGNVALDVARILTTRPDELARTDISEHALEALRASRIQEVVLVARRGPAQSAFTVPELLGLLQTPGIEVVVDAPPAALAPSAGETAAATPEHVVGQKMRLVRELPPVSAPRVPGTRRIVLRYLAAPVSFTGERRVTGVELTRTRLSTVGDFARIPGSGDTEILEAGLVLTSIGYHGAALDGLPFDDVLGVIPNAAGRILQSAGGDVLRGRYVTGWIKRGPSGFIGTNKSCAQETVRCLVEDYNAGLLADPPGRPDGLRRALGERRHPVVDGTGWRAIDRAERAGGAPEGRPRRKITDRRQLLAVAASKTRRVR